MLLIIYLINLISFITAIPIVCYYKFNEPPVKHVPVNLCDYVILIGSSFVDNNGRLQINKTELEQFQQLKEVKKLICVTGQNPSFTLMSSSQTLLQLFANDASTILSQYNLDGIDIDWEFPVWSHDAHKDDKLKFSNILKIMHATLKPSSKILSIAVSGPPTITKRAYNVQDIARYADMVQVMNYDFHIYHPILNPVVGFNAPLGPLRYEFGLLAEMNSASSMSQWLQLGLPANKTFFGVPTYPRSFKLLSKHFHKPYSPAIGTFDGIYSTFADVCRLEHFTTVWNKDAYSPYMYKDHTWISYESIDSVREKVSTSRQRWNPAGIMVFSIGADDHSNLCGYGAFPLIRQIRQSANQHDAQLK